MLNHLSGIDLIRNMLGQTLSKGASLLLDVNVNFSEHGQADNLFRAHELYLSHSFVVDAEDDWT